MQCFALDGFSDADLKLALFKNVQNSRDLKSKHLSRVALLDAGLLVSVFQLRVAATMAVEKEKSGKMKTRSLPSEIVWSLSGSKNMSGSLQTFCVREEKGADLLVAAIGIKDQEFQVILADVQGQPCGLDELGQGLEAEGQGGREGALDRLKKMYKITDEELAMSSLEDCVIMRMAVKDH